MSESNVIDLQRGTNNNIDLRMDAPDDDWMQGRNYWFNTII